MRAARVTVLPPPIVYATVPRLWVDDTAVILASGPSLCAADVDACRGRVKVIAVKDAIRLAPWADAAYFCGADASRWWQFNTDRLLAFAGLKYTLDPRAAHLAQVLRNTGETGLEVSPTGLRTGRNSGYQAIGLAYLLGATRILLLGFDMAATAHGPKYFFGDREPNLPSPFAAFLQAFATIVEPLRQLGVTVINCSRDTALEVFPRQGLTEALG